MHLIELLIQKNQLSGRNRITPLGWLLVGIVALFMGALVFGWFRFITRNVSMFDVTPTLTIAQGAKTPETTTAPTPITIEGAPNWSLKIVKTPLGVDLVEAPSEVTQAVLKNYDEALDDWDAHKFDLKYLQQIAPKYFIGKQLSRVQGMLSWMEQEKRAVALREYELLPLERSVQYAPNGTQVFLVEYIAAGKTHEYDLNTRAKVDEQKLPDRIVMTELSYDAEAKRWKISRFALAMDLETKQVLWQDH